MMSFCKPCVVATDFDLEALFSAGYETKNLALETSELCAETQSRSEMVVNFAQEIKSTLTTLADTKAVTPAAFVTILDLLNDKKMKETLALAGEMDDLALECVGKASEMSTAMQRGVDSLPDVIKGDLDQDDTSDTDGDDEFDLAEFENDITELEECTEGLRSMNLLTAGTKGKSAFEGLANKGSACESLFRKIKDLCATVGKICETFLMDNCCKHIKAGLDCLKDMRRCLRLSNLINTLAALGRRLIKSFINLMNVAWEKFGQFTEEFEAAKKLKNWVDGLDPSALNSDAGNFVKNATGLVGSIFSG